MPPPHSQKTGSVSWPVLRVLTGCIILTTAGMKAHQLATTPDLEQNLIRRQLRWNRRNGSEKIFSFLPYIESLEGARKTENEEMDSPPLSL
jgi:hypothetical protein